MPAPVDVHAEVLANTRLSADYNVLVLAAPAIAATTQPGQFVMIRTADGTDPLLRRPFSVFEVLRQADRAPHAISILCKRVGVGTSRLFAAAIGDHLDCLGPLGKPFTAVSPPDEAWLVAGGVGLAPFATLTDQLRSAGTTTRLFYGGRSQTDLFYLDWFENRGVTLELATEDGSRRSLRRPGSRCMPAGRSRCSGPSRIWRASINARHNCRPSAPWVAAWVDATAAWSACGNPTDACTLSAHA
jgi:NAD(P)H-flavin reductase